MSSKNKLDIKIRGKNYTLVGEESQEYLLKISNYVDKNLATLLKLNKSLSLEMASILTSLNTVRDLFKSIEREDILTHQLEEMKIELELLRKEKSLPTNNSNKKPFCSSDLKQANEKINVLVQDNKRLFDENSNLKNLNYQLKSELSKLRKKY